MWTRRLRRLFLLLIDALLVAFAFGAAYELRFDFHVPAEYKLQFLHLVLLVVIIRVFLFFLFNLYRGLLRYASIGELIAILISVTLGTIILALLNMIIQTVPRWGTFPLDDFHKHLLRIPWAVIFIDWILVILLIGGGRFARRIMLTAGQRLPPDAKRVIIIGAGDLGEMVARDMMKNPQRGYRPIVFIDEDRAKIKSRIHNLEVVGDIKELQNAIERYGIDEIIIALPDTSPRKIREIIDECKKTRVAFKIVPSMHDLMEGKVTISQIRPVEIEDLLGREPIMLELPPEKNYMRDEIVLVTGAGGSIGSELSRQIILYKPKTLVLFGKGENSIYEIAADLNYSFQKPHIKLEIGDIRDENRLQRLFAQYKPSIIFHAAAHKHVPLMELNPDEAVTNNIIGTYRLALTAHESRAKRFILISTDKAVRPSSIMGATKRVAEIIVASLGKQSSTAFLSVRFGNVLGSRGSVIPLFKKQIERGGPVTVTHQDVMRYFMTIREAVSLVIHAGSMADRGTLFLLDMGKPVKIADLAANLIALSGFEPGEDIEIAYTGLRPGEKLFEELLTEGEGIQSTEIGKIFATRSEVWEWNDLVEKIRQLEDRAKQCDVEGIKRLLKELVPDYEPFAV